ncbi:hypothetical protein MASR1M12_18860 [Erysipelotrichia bacterium]
MNLAQLYSKLLTVLAESASPQYWSQLELYGYINDGLIEFVRRTKILQKTAYLDKNANEIGSYFLPLDIIEPLSVQYKGRPLDKKNTKFFEVAYAGTSHQRVLSGLGNVFARSWREMTGTPSHWFFENKFVKLFPKPISSVAFPGNSPVQRTTATWHQGTSVVQLSIQLPYDKKDSVDVFVNGIYQNSQDWNINPGNNTQILFATPATVNMSVEVVRQMSIALTVKLSASVSAGNTTFNWPNCGYSNVRDSVRVVLAGIVMQASDYTLNETEGGGLIVTLQHPASASGVIEVTIYTPPDSYVNPSRTADDEVTMSYVYMPQSLLEGADPSFNEPETPAFFHSACWQWAAFLALSKEGEKTQDLKKAQIFLTQFETSVNNANSFVGGEVDVDPAVQMPWRM